MQICVAVDDGNLPKAPPAQQRFVAALQVGLQRPPVAAHAARHEGPVC